MKKENPKKSQEKLAKKQPEARKEKKKAEQKVNIG
jgi:hypothetical protein